MHDKTERLNKFLAFSLGISRREADSLIESGSVNVNGVPALLGGRVSAHDIVVTKGKVVTPPGSYRYFAFHKPVGYVCSRKAQGDNPTIYDLLAPDMHSLKPVGRLDKDSSGLLLLTDDGDFAHSMTHPSFKKVKVYEIELDRALEPLHQQMIADYGIEIGDGTSKLSLERQDDSRTRWIVTMHEGRNRQIRRTFAALGYTTVALHRVKFGSYSIGTLEHGTYAAIKV